MNDKDFEWHYREIEIAVANITAKVAKLEWLLDAARLCLKHRDRTPAEEKVYAAIREILTKETK